MAARARPNTVRAYAHDLKTFFDVVGKEPADVVPADVLAFVSAQRRSRPGAENVVRISDGSGGLSEATIKRRLAAVSSLYGYLITLGRIVETNPVPRGLPTRRSRWELRGVPLVRGTRRLPRMLNPDEVEALMAALRIRRDRAMVQAMLLGGMRRCEVLGCAWAMCAWASGGCWWPRARVATSGSSRCRARSSPPSPPTSATSVLPTPPPIASLSC